MKHALVVLTNAVAGREEEFDDWYSNQHLAEVLRIDGFVAAQRFELAPAGEAHADAPYRYLAIYEIADGKLDDARRALAEAIAEPGRPRMASSGALADDRCVWWFTTIGERVSAEPATTQG